MAAVPQPFEVVGDTYTVPGQDTIEALSASVVFDGSGASGDFRPSLAFYSQTGHLLSRTFPAVAVSAGSSAEVSFIPFVPPASDSTPALPLWKSILADLTLNNGTIDHTASRFSLAMVQAPSHFASVLLKLRIVLLDPGDNTLPYGILGLPSFAWGFADNTETMAVGWSWTGGLNAWTPPATASFVGADNFVVFPLGVQPAFQTGDILFDGFGVYPWNPE